jgi:hypothetical protein
VEGRDGGTIGVTFDGGGQPADGGHLGDRRLRQQPGGQPGAVVGHLGELDGDRPPVAAAQDGAVAADEVGGGAGEVGERPAGARPQPARGNAGCAQRSGGALPRAVGRGEPVVGQAGECPAEVDERAGDVLDGR